VLCEAHSAVTLPASECVVAKDRIGEVSFIALSSFRGDRGSTMPVKKVAIEQS